MGLLSRTGLIAGVTRPVHRNVVEKYPNLQTIARPAPFCLKPTAGFYNPYSNACSLFCNHPTPALPAPIIKNKDGIHVIPYTGYNEGSLTESDIEAQMQQNSSVPEELFRRYTETDSRPLTPTPTVWSAATASAPRRCVTPQPTQRPKLVVDLRRTHSQETLSWTVHSEHGRPFTGDSPRSSQTSSKTSFEASLPAPSKSIIQPSPVVTPRPKIQKKTPRQQSSELVKVETTPFIEENIADSNKDPESDEDIPRRRGKKKKQKTRVSTALKTADKDPETQVEAMGLDLQADDEGIGVSVNEDTGAVTIQVPDVVIKDPLESFDSYLEPAVLKVLQRELNREDIENEFDYKRKLALQEAYRCITGNKKVASWRNLQWSSPATDLDQWLNLPREFSRSSVWFDLPLEIEELENLTPMMYVKNHVSICNTRKLLFNFVFNRHKEENLDEEDERFMLGKTITVGLGEIMGKPLNEKQKDFLHTLLQWNDNDQIDFRTWAGICALCERLLASEFCSKMKDKTEDPPYEVERADFETLTRKIAGLQINEQLVKILMSIRNM